MRDIDDIVKDIKLALHDHKDSLPLQVMWDLDEIVARHNKLVAKLQCDLDDLQEEYDDLKHNNEMRGIKI